MTGHHHRLLVCAVFMIGAIAPALAQQPGLNTIYTFPSGSPGTTGYWPRGGLAMDSAGALYGTTYYGGNCPINFPYCGTIYKLAPPPTGQTVWSYQLLHAFSQQEPIQGHNEDGIEPISPLTNYENVMYGTASAGGDTNCGCGAVFSITPSGTYTILHVFDPFVPGAADINQWPDGTTPIGGLLINNGTIYGTTSAGGTGAVGPDGTNGAGIIYSMSTTGANFKVLHNFDGSLNAGPQGMMIFGQDSAIYGTQYGGGMYNQGVIWRMPIGGTYQVIYNFLGNVQPGGSTDGADPEGRLALGPDGTIYGTTSFGGDPSGDGTAWSIKLVNGSWVYNQIYEFNGNTGGSLPHSGLILASDGALYGTTSGGGTYGGGTFYKLVPQSNGTWSYVTLQNFIPLDPNGNSPYGDLLYTNNSFYGMNLTGGAVSQCDNGCGTVFQFNLGPAAPTLQVSPTTSIATSGSQGGPFSPASFQYQLSASAGTIDYAISGYPNWLTPSSTSGTASTGTTVTFTANATANSLVAGTYGPTTITFTNSDTGQGTQTRTATLTVNSPGLKVTPSTGIAASGQQGGPFTPSSFPYSLSAATGSVSYKITNVPSWLTASPTSGTVTTKGTTVTFRINTSAADKLSVGTNIGNIGFNTANNQVTTRSATLTVTPKNYTVKVSASPTADGTVTGGGTFAGGTSDTATATPKTGHTFLHWTESGKVVSTSESYTFTVSANTTLVADFK
jgi:uncharacterized repeat protein (TIGR03803 family)